MDASAYSLISTGSGSSTSGDSGYLDQHHTQLDNHLHHPLHHQHQHHHSLSNLINEDEDLEHDYHLHSHSHHLHHLSSHSHSHNHNQAHGHGHQLRHASSPYGLDLLTGGGDQSLMAVDSCELMGLGASDDDDDLQGTLTSFVCTDLGAESDTGYTSGVDGYFNHHSSTSLIDQCGGGGSSDSQDAYCFRQFSLDSSLDMSGCGTNTGEVNGGTSPLFMCQQSNNNNNLNNLGDFNQSDNQSAITSFSGCSYTGDGGGSTSSSICSTSNYSDIINNSSDYYTSSGNNYYSDCTQPTSDMTCQQQQLLLHNSQRHNNHSMGHMQQIHGQSSSSVTTPGQTKRSVLMNLLIDGSDISAGYTSINSRALQSIN